MVPSDWRIYVCEDLDTWIDVHGLYSRSIMYIWIQIYTSSYLSMYLSICLPIHLYLSVFLYCLVLSVYLSAYASIHLLPYLAISFSNFVSLYLPICVSLCLVSNLVLCLSIESICIPSYLVILPNQQGEKTLTLPGGARQWCRLILGELLSRVLYMFWSSENWVKNMDNSHGREDF